MDKTAEKFLNWLAEAPDDDLAAALSDGLVQKLAEALVPSWEASGHLPYKYLMDHKDRLVAAAQLRLLLTHRASVKGIVNGTQAFIAPDARQWFDDGVMFTQGQAPFEGLIGLYREERVLFATVARDIGLGETSIGPGELVFVDVEETRAAIEKRRGLSLAEMEAGLEALHALLSERCEQEAKYQEVLENHPWILGGHYRSVEAHRSLDERNIPDFTAVRSRDGHRDIIEIKQPFAPVFRQDGEFHSHFNDAWNQLGGYLSFAAENADYLAREKGLQFHTPRGWLLVGHELPADVFRRIRQKEGLTPAITVMTYDQLFRLGVQVLELIRNASSGTVSGTQSEQEAT